MAADKATVIYWERQRKAYCGIHCVNNLLQSALFDEKDFGKMAAVIDVEEKKIMGTDYWRFSHSENDDVNGNFSVQVIIKALEMQRGGGGTKTVVENILSKDMREAYANPVYETGFVVNTGNHWFALRKVEGQWYNLDSLQGGPRKISDATLKDYIESVIAQGKTVYVVRGTYPRSVGEQPAKTQLPGRGDWFDSRTLTALPDSDFMTKARFLMEQATQAETAGRRDDAAILYKSGLEYLWKVEGQKGRFRSLDERTRFRARIEQYQLHTARLEALVKADAARAPPAAAPPAPAGFSLPSAPTATPVHPSVPTASPVLPSVPAFDPVLPSVPSAAPTAPLAPAPAPAAPAPVPIFPVFPVEPQVIYPVPMDLPCAPPGTPAGAPPMPSAYPATPSAMDESGLPAFAPPSYDSRPRTDSAAARIISAGPGSIDAMLASLGSEPLAPLPSQAWPLPPAPAGYAPTPTPSPSAPPATFAPSPAPAAPAPAGATPMPFSFTTPRASAMGSGGMGGSLYPDLSMPGDAAPAPAPITATNYAEPRAYYAAAPAPVPAFSPPAYGTAPTPAPAPAPAATGGYYAPVGFSSPPTGVQPYAAPVAHPAHPYGGGPAAYAAPPATRGYADAVPAPYGAPAVPAPYGAPGAYAPPPTQGPYVPAQYSAPAAQTPYGAHPPPAAGPAYDPYRR